MPKSEMSPSDPLSKTRRKQDMLDLQKLGKKLVALPPSQLEKFDLPDTLREAIQAAHNLTAHGAIKRHAQYIGKLMREVDVTPILTVLKILQSHHEKQTDTFHMIEQWRDRLVVGSDEVLQELLETHPDGDRQQLRQLIRKAKLDIANEKNTGGDRALFIYLQEWLAKAE